ncbi:MAG: hypothetical protein VXX36_03765 [Verrucomicrobiota bacterium]|nr:hypothetical protein [Verrucomicrobiota bacterium]
MQDFYPAILQYKKLKVGLYRGDKTTSIGTFLGMGVIVVMIAMTVTVIAMHVVMLVLAMIVAVSIIFVHSFAMVMISMGVIPMVMNMIGVVSAGNIASGKGTSAEQ